MGRHTILTALIPVLLAGAAAAQSREEKVRNDRKKVEAGGFWLYNDVPRAFAQARASGKPIVAVLRCLPCEECVKLDDQIIDADPRIRRLLEEFVRVRIVSTNGLDLSLFQFDTDQSFAVFLLNADGAIYGRFGTRSHRTEWADDVSVEGLAKALTGALALHKAYPDNQGDLAGKRGPAPAFATPETFPSFKGQYRSVLDYEGPVVKSCIHCHQIGDAMRDLAFSRKEPLPEDLLFPYPHPKIIGLILDPRERATVLRVEPGSDAERAGFRPGDAIRKLAGQPLLSIADVQWVLHGAAADGAEIKAEVLRDGQPVSLVLRLPQGWRQRGDLSWRASTWGLRQRALGGMLLADLPDEERRRLGLSAGSTALRVEHVGQYPPHNLALRAGVRKGDVLVAYNDRNDLLRETDVIAHALRTNAPGRKVTLTVLRDGKRHSFDFIFPG
ncbi:MAG: PDZ domain-containing protein [Phycisphaerae bacterium]|jgi:hypothetical protein